MKKIRVTLFLFIIFTSACFGQLLDTLRENPLQKYLAFPLIIRSPETEWGLGAAVAYLFRACKKDADSRTSVANIAALYTQRKQFLVSLNSND